MSQNFFKITRANGETFYFNISQIGMIYYNPADKAVFVNGNGFEKKFRMEEGKEVLALFDALSGVAPAPVPEETPAPPAEPAA